MSGCGLVIRDVSSASSRSNKEMDSMSSLSRTSLSNDSTQLAVGDARLRQIICSDVKCAFTNFQFLPRDVHEKLRNGSFADWFFAFPRWSRRCTKPQIFGLWFPFRRSCTVNKTTCTAPSCLHSMLFLCRNYDGSVDFWRWYCSVMQ